jgi:ferredoxin
MSPGILKTIRRVIALFFMLSTVLLFSGLAALLPEQAVRYITWIQFIPSFLRFTFILSIYTSGFILVIIMTLFYGRVYCSFICPLGIFQDIFIRLSAIFLKRENTYKRPLYAFSFSLLLICILPLFFHNILFLNLLDPFGLSGKIFAGPRGTLALSTGLLLFFMLLSMSKNRWYCNLICPVGILLGLISRVSFFRLRVDVSRCRSCGTCEAGCRSNCIDFRDHRLDFDRCVGCMDCLDSCPEKALKYKFRWKKRNEPVISDKSKVDLSRRAFLKTTACGAVTMAGFISTSALAVQPEQVMESHPVMPPGAISLSHFTEKCTACQLCISTCPTHVLQTSFFEYGLSGLFQPKMDFSRSFCRYDCVKCPEICPTGAIQLLTLKEKQKVQIGLAVFQKNQCLVVAEHKTCAKCAEHCPTKAIELLPYLGSLFIPYVNSSFCNGCGACEYYCPVRPDRAIYVEAKLYHRKLV